MQKKSTENGVEDSSLRTGTEADNIEAVEPTPKKRKKTSKAFQDNIITDSETAKAKGKKGGQQSAKVRRENAQKKKDAREAARYLLDLAAKGQLNDNLKNLGYPEDERTNMAALVARMFTAAIQKADQDAFFAILKVAGYDPEEERKERESKAADIRRERELDAKIQALGAKTDNASVAVNLNDEDDNNDVVIYMPQIATEESRQEVSIDETITDSENAPEEE